MGPVFIATLVLTHVRLALQVGGSVTKLKSSTNDEAYLVSFTAVFTDDESAADDGYSTFVYEVDAEGDAGAWLALPALPSWATAGRYRVVPRSSVYGEAESSPFGTVGGDTDSSLSSSLANATRPTSPLANSSNATGHPLTSPENAVDDDTVDDQMPINVGITDDTDEVDPSMIGTVSEPSFLKQLGIRLGYALRPQVQGTIKGAK